MRLKRITPTHNSLNICCTICNKAFPEKEMFADLDVTNRYICQLCANEICEINTTNDEEQLMIHNSMN